MVRQRNIFELPDRARPGIVDPNVDAPKCPNRAVRQFPYLTCCETSVGTTTANPPAASLRADLSSESPGLTLSSGLSKTLQLLRASGLLTPQR